MHRFTCLDRSLLYRRLHHLPRRRRLPRPRCLPRPGRLLRCQRHLRRRCLCHHHRHLLLHHRHRRLAAVPPSAPALQFRTLRRAPVFRSMSLLVRVEGTGALATAAAACAAPSHRTCTWSAPRASSSTTGCRHRRLRQARCLRAPSRTQSPHRHCCAAHLRPHLHHPHRHAHHRHRLPRRRPHRRHWTSNQESS